MAINKTIKYLRALLFSGVIILSGTQSLQAQIQRYNANGDNNYGVVYTLPKTRYVITVTTISRQFTPGELAPWAANYIGRDVTTKPWETHEIKDIQIRAIGIPNKDRQYLVAFDKKTIAPFVALAPGGILYSINGKAQKAAIIEPALQVFPKPDRSMPSFPREYSLATTMQKRAEIAASYLYDVRENMMNIVSGEVDQMPKDGESMRLILDKLRSEEARTLRLFEGDTTTTMKREEFIIDPEDHDVEHSLVFFSSKQGLTKQKVDDDSKPLQLKIRIVERAPELDPKELARREKGEGIVYNLPGTAEVSVSYNGKVLRTERLPITQAGTIQTLSKKMMNLKEATTTAIYFDVRSGALESVTTE